MGIPQVLTREVILMNFISILDMIVLGNGLIIQGSKMSVSFPEFPLVH